MASPMMPLYSVDSLIAGVGVHNAHNNLMPALALTGGENSPLPSLDANDPGLQEQSTYEGLPQMKTSHWIVVALVIVGILLALWYFGGSTAPSA